MPKRPGATSRKQLVRREPARKAPTKGKAAPKSAAKKAPSGSAARPGMKAGVRAAASKTSAAKAAASKSAAAKSAASKPAASRSGASKPAAAKSARTVASPPNAAPASAGKGKAGANSGHQGSLEFEAGPPHPPAELPTPKRRSSKVGGPDWPGENLTVGMAAPDFELPSTLGRKITLHEFRGKRVILYFYPKDDTPGCTMEACAFRDNLPRFDLKDGVVLGISLDDELSHQRFAQKYNLNFPLLSDVDAAVCRQYGVYKEKNMYGRSFWGIERTTFVVDREGKVENVFRRVKVEGHADEVLATLAV